jgi:hypothetical protein
VALNALHITEAFTRLPDLLPQPEQQQQPLQQPPPQQQQPPKRLSAVERQRVAALVQFLCQRAQQQAQALSLDTQGLSLVLLGLSKLGHRDGVLLDELQLALLLRLQEASCRHVAVALSAFAALGLR